MTNIMRPAVSETLIAIISFIDSLAALHATQTHTQGITAAEKSSTIQCRVSEDVRTALSDIR